MKLKVRKLQLTGSSFLLRQSVVAMSHSTREVMELRSAGQILVVGLGSHHGADVIGWLTVRALNQLDERLPIIEATSPADLLDRIQESDRLVICDGCQGAGEVGSIHHWRWPHFELWRLKSSTTHTLSLVDMLQLAEILENRPRVMELWGIEVPADESTVDQQWLSTVAAFAAAQIHAGLNDA